MDDLAASFPLVGAASHTQFAPAGVLAFPSVQSRMVLGCHEGSGIVVLDGVEQPLRRGVMYLLPWGHAITYRADRDDPFYVYGMHVIPAHRADAPVELTIAHDPRHHLYASSARSPGSPPSGGRRVVATDEAQRPGLAMLVRYTISVFAAGPTEDQARALGRLAMTELDRAPALDVREDPAVPPDLRRLLRWIDTGLAGPLTLRDLTRFDGRGASTLTRLFRRHLGRSPMDWVLQTRLDRASSMLASTHLGIAEIARANGIDDPYYFSRVFKSRTGLAPREWRTRQQI
jgi:AraC family transcriptional regulator, arabinose operon regulatory protein